MLAIGIMIKLTDMEFILTWMEQYIKVTGRKTNNTDRELKLGLMELATQVDMNKERNMDKALLNGLMAQNIQDNFIKIIFMVTELTFGQIKEST